VQRNPEEWSDPHSFCPNRFAQGEEEPPRYTYLPFGEGRHLCLGKHFGEIEATLAAATILKRYRLEFLDDIPLAPAPGLTLKPRDTAHMRITFR
jgi:cytochrome P450